MTDPGISAPTPEAALAALFAPFESRALTLPADGHVLFLRARAGARLREMAQPGWLCEQGFAPFSDALTAQNLRVGSPGEGERFALVLVLPPRQRDEARALYARAVGLLAPGGAVLAAVPNAEGARTAETDLAKLCGAVQHLSKHKCRAFWSSPEAGAIDQTLLSQWLALDEPMEITGGYISRHGLFAGDRIDRASKLLAEHLPDDLYGRVADLGAGWGYLAAQVAARCPRVTAIDLYEAEQRALEPARINLQRAAQASDRAVEVGVHWHDVTRGLSQRYEAVVSNPPFHQGRADLPALGRAFITSAADALLPGGRFWLVANRHLPYETLLRERFGHVREVTQKDGFKVIEARL